jgi:ATP-dependent helicase/nuclease subunit A
MAQSKKKAPPDQKQREAAIRERERNVLVDAGAGTGKTTILVERLVELVAPSGEGRAIPISRIAAITFTRKAAGELRLRIRERFLGELSKAKPGTEREGQLREAVAELDTAYVGTIHSFADRLLRRRPVEAELSPSYEIAEDDQALIRETFDVLLQAVQSGTLAAELSGSPLAGRAVEATQTILNALDAGLRADSLDLEFWVRYGLDELFAAFIRYRDLPPPDLPPAEFDFALYRSAADEFIALANPVENRSTGAAWILQTARVLRRLRDLEDPVEMFWETRQQLDRAPPNQARKKNDFADADDAWRVWKRYKDKDKQTGRSLKDALCAPLDRWMATRLARLFPVVIFLYEKVKARRRQLDQIDLLLKLRTLLAEDKQARAEYQSRFDHIFVDEFQDTDPLQAEIVLYICEKEPRADRWQDVVLADGKLTLVGDPKQSIYRFRRADIAIYERVRAIVARQKHLEVTLSANFRSVPLLIEWFNNRFARILGQSPDGNPFDPTTGKVFQQPLAQGRQGDQNAAVHVLPFDFVDGQKHGVDEYRELEGRALARYLRWLIEESQISVIDSFDGQPRRIRYGDIAILAVSTWRLSLLFPKLDAEGIPYASRGGTLFLTDPLHRQFLLGLRALADRDDGVAEAALLRPPFFAIDLADLLREQAKGNGRDVRDERVDRARAARELVRELRQQRFDRSPGTTARELLDRSAFARAVALGPNGAQRLARLRELCHIFEKLAADERLDYDAASATLRDWVDNPIQLDPPHPVSAEAVQMLTVHQAKGLEFPVVAIWDGKGEWNARLQPSPWRMERDGRGWMVNLDKLTWEEPAGLGIRQTEQQYLDAERRRVAYVAATRARDLLIVPKAGGVAPGKYMCGDFLDDVPATLFQTVETYVDSEEPSWSRQLKAVERKAPGDGSKLEQQVLGQWKGASIEAARPRLRPVSVSALAGDARHIETEEAVEALPLKDREGRYGGLFGSTVHHAIGLLLRGSGMTLQNAVQHAAKLYGLAEHLEEAVADVERALDALRTAGLVRSPAADLQLEYPVSGPWTDGQLASGYIDLVAVEDGCVDIIDFKTDMPPAGPVEQAYPKYAAQVRIYGKLLETTGLLKDRHLRCGLLFTADGSIQWIDL